MADAKDPVSNTTKQVSGLTFKAFLTGAIASFALSAGVPYADMAIRGSYMSLLFCSPGALFLFFVLVGVVNVLLGAIHRRLALNRAELITVYIMLIVASAIPMMTMSRLPFFVTVPAYYATPENEWAQLILPHIKGWLVPEGADVVKHFYEGLPQGASIPWGVWAKPLVAWGAFLLVLYFVMMCIMVILRKQWVERERLVFPLVLVSLDMVREDGRASLIKPFFRNPVMWIGFIIPVIITSMNGLHAYFDFVPGIRYSTHMRIFRNTTRLFFWLSFPVIGFSYLVNLDIAFSLWFFFVLGKMQVGIFRMIGIASTEKLGFFTNTSPIVAHQGTGAMLVLALFGLWMARGHLRRVFAAAFGRATSAEDSGEMLSYRTAVLGLIGGLIFMSAWLWMSGLPLLIAVLFLAVSYLLFLAMTRVVSEAGLAEGALPMMATSFVTSGIGTSVLGSTGLTALGFAHVYVADTRNFVMVSCANGLRLAGELGGRRRRLFWAMMLAIVVSIGASVWVILKLAYAYGGINLEDHFPHVARHTFQLVENKLRNPSGPHWGGWAATGIGAGVMALLMLARHHLLWWPLHPLGFAVGSVLWIECTWVNIFLAWLAKSLVLRYGGPKLYRATRPLFLGLILGQFVIAGVWLVIDAFTGMTDNRLFVL